MSHAGPWTLTTTLVEQDAGHWMIDAGRWTLTNECLAIIDAGRWILFFFFIYSLLVYGAPTGARRASGNSHQIQGVATIQRLIPST